MKTQYLDITARDPLVSRDGRPFGVGQGYRMRSLDWLLPSVVAGSCRTAMVKATPELDFSGDMPAKLLQVSVAGVFPASSDELYLPAPDDAIAEPTDDSLKVKCVHRLTPQAEISGGVFFADSKSLLPVMLSEAQAANDFKPVATPAWWPVSQYARWLTEHNVQFNSKYLQHPLVEHRDHVCIDADSGAAEESKLFATAGLNLTHLPKFHVSHTAKPSFAEIRLSGRIVLNESSPLEKSLPLNVWHPLGGERRMAHWQSTDSQKLWKCPPDVTKSLSQALRVRMVLATPAVFSRGWKPGWLDDQLEGTLPETDVRLKLVGVCNGRWKAVSGWSLQRINEQGQLDAQGEPGPKPIRRMVPAGSVYFFEVIGGDAADLAKRWLTAVSDDAQECRDGFGLAVFGTW